MATIGMIYGFIGENPPNKFLVADGSPVSRTLYASLFSAIGVRYGSGDGINTFNLPDVRGYFPRFQTLSSGIDPNVGTRIPRQDGATTDNPGTTQLDSFGSHYHKFFTGTGLVGFPPYISGGCYDQFSNQNLTVPEIGYAGGNETRPKNINLLGIICVEV